jgi:hypothetical protein
MFPRMLEGRLEEPPKILWRELGWKLRNNPLLGLVKRFNAQVFFRRGDPLEMRYEHKCLTLSQTQR